MLKENKNILFLITFGIILYIILENISFVWNLFLIIISLFIPFILGIAIAYVLNILMDIIEKKLLKNISGKRGLSIILTLLLVLCFISFIIILIIPELRNAVILFIDNIPLYKSKIIELATSLNLSTSTIETLKSGIDNLINSVTNLLKSNAKDIFVTTSGVAISIVSGFTNFILGLVFAIYMLASKEKLISQLKKIINAYLKKDHVNKLMNIANISNNIFKKFIIGQLTEALIIGFLCFLGMVILRIPYALPVSALVGFTALIPVFGAFIGTFIGAILIFVISPIKALIFICYIIILQQVEGNFIYPKVVGTNVGLPGIWVMLAVIIGGSLFGIVGMLIGVPITSIIYYIFGNNTNNILKKKQITIK